MHHGFRHPEAHMETVTMFIHTPTPIPTTTSPSTSIVTATSIPATIPLPANPTGHYKSENWNSSRSICFPEEPLTSEYKTQCWVNVFDLSFINDKIAQSLIPCCYGRLDVVGGCGYQCISNYTEGPDDKGVTYVAPVTWWLDCLHKSDLPRYSPEVASNKSADWDGAWCADRPSISGPKMRTERRLFAVMVVIGAVLPVVLLVLVILLSQSTPRTSISLTPDVPLHGSQYRDPQRSIPKPNLINMAVRVSTYFPVTPTITVPATIPWHAPAPTISEYRSSPHKYFGFEVCFPEEPITTNYQAQCYVPVNPAYMNQNVSDSIRRCCLGRFDVVEGFGYQCISNVTEILGDSWWDDCVLGSTLYKGFVYNETDMEGNFGQAVCEPPPSIAAFGALMQGKLMATMFAIGIVLPMVVF
ncbi:hypothetical protein TWF594_005960 [Orbilia oligospora]|nr:hypothetical protein TWF594_005960 [Orbilia oligospora]